MDQTPVWLLMGEQPVDLHPDHTVSLPTTLRATIAAELDVLAALSAVAPKLPARLLAFLESGRDEQSLDALSSEPEAAKLLDLYPARRGQARHNKPRALWLGECGRLSPILTVRLGTVFAACTHGAAPRHFNQVPSGPEFQWPRALVAEASWLLYGEPPPVGWLEMEQLEAAVVAAGGEPDLLVRCYTQAKYRDSQRISMPSFARGCARYPQHVARALDEAKGAAREDMLRDFVHLDLPVAPWLSQLVALATSNAKAVRGLSRQWILQSEERTSDSVVDAFGAVLQSGVADTRAQAADFLGLLKCERAQIALRTALEARPSAKVRGVIEAALASTSVATEDTELGALAPPYDPGPDGPLDDAVRVLLEQVFDEWYVLAEANPQAATRGQEARPVSQQERQRFWQLLSDPARWQERPEGPFENQPWAWSVKNCRSLRALLDHKDLTPVHLVRATYLLQKNGFERELDAVLRRHRRRCGVAYDLRTVALALEHAGLGAARVAEEHRSSYRPAFRWEPAAVWPYFAEHLEPLDAALGMSDASSDSDSQGWALTVLSWLPTLPQRYQGVAWSHAFGGNPLLAGLGRRCMARVPGLFERVVVPLADKTQDVRAAAATWLGELGDARAIEVLKAALAKEKQSVPRARYLEALEKLGVPPEQLLDREQLCAEARRGLAKGFPEQLAWLRRESMPALRWRDHTPLPREVSDWWLVEAFKGK
jgi:hypothetical protein